MKIRHFFIPFKDKEIRQGLSEKIIRRRLEKEGWEVWKGGLISVVRQDDIYPNVRRKYERLCSLLDEKKPRSLIILQYFCDVHHGMPDFICYRRGEFKFVECKLGYEQVSERQKVCMRKLKELGFGLEVHKLSYPGTRNRIVDIDLATGEKKILDMQLRLTLKQPNHSM